jgi:hypothetical protein
VYGRNFRCADVEKGTPLVVQMLGEGGGGALRRFTAASSNGRVPNMGYRQG